ncbi:MAG: polysaccharide export protein [Verrucomicrobia bacterium]|nr:polysaccharide export protein [Verrucomicrobiota bacterium]
MHESNTRHWPRKGALALLLIGLIVATSCSTNRLASLDDDEYWAEIMSRNLESGSDPKAAQGGESDAVEPADPADEASDTAEAADPADEASDTAAETDVAAAQTGRGARLKPGLTVQVKVLVLGKAEVNEENRRISDEGSLALPLIGNVHVAGMNLPELNRELTRRYSDYFLKPQVVVDYVMETGEEAISPWGYVTVLGKVKHPGRVNIPPTRDLTVSSAIQRVGGFDTSAKDSEIRVTRLDKPGEPEIITVNLRDLGSKRVRKKNDIILQPGDVVRVPEKFF